MNRLKQKGPGLDRVMSRDQIASEADRLARSVLHVSAANAFRQLDRGKLAGTVIEAELKMLRRMLPT
jgi:hypothetical protein